MPKNNKEFSEKDYLDSRKKSGIGYSFYSFAYSFGGKKWGGWSRGRSKSGSPCDYVSEAYRSAKKQSVKIQKDIVFKCGGYYEFDISQAIIYCDPPYKGCQGYGASFNHKEFYTWIRKQKEKGSDVFVSEYEMPDDFKCIWEGSVRMTLKVNDNKTVRNEKLFTL